MGELVMARTFRKPAIGEFHQVFTGVVADQQIGYAGLMGLVGKKLTGCGTITSDDANVTLSQKKWQPQDIFVRLEQCFKDLEQSFFVYSQHNGVDRPDLNGTDFANFIEDRLSDAVYEAILRLAYFGNVDAATVTDSPAGSLTDGTDADYFNPINGLWKQLFAIGTANADQVVSIAKNSGTDYAAQAFDANDVTGKTVTGILESLKYEADYRLRDQPDLVMVATQSVVDQYAKELRNQNLDASFVRIESGYDALMFENIPVIPMNFWDRMIYSYFDDGTTYLMPHRAILTTRTNLGIATDSTAALDDIDVWFDKRDKKTYFDVQFKLDAKVIDDDLLQLAY